MYSWQDIQNMIEIVNEDKEKRSKLFTLINKSCSFADGSAIKRVIEEGYYEAFDRFDSDVCEQFITLFEKI